MFFSRSIPARKPVLARKGGAFQIFNAVREVPNPIVPGGIIQTPCSASGSTIPEVLEAILRELPPEATQWVEREGRVPGTLVYTPPAGRTWQWETPRAHRRWHWRRVPPGTAFYG